MDSVGRHLLYQVGQGLAIVLGLATLGYFVEDPEAEAKRKHIPTPEELFNMTPEEQQEVLQKKLIYLSREEQEEYVQKIQEISQRMAMEQQARPHDHHSESPARGGPRSRVSQGPTRSALPSSGGSKDDETIALLLTRADIARQQGKLVEADQFYVKALDALAKDPEIGVNHYFYGLTTYALALVYRDKGDLVKAESLILKSFPLLKAETEKENLTDPRKFAAHIQSLNQLADAAAVLSDISMSLDKFQQAEKYLGIAFETVSKKIKILDSLPVQTLEEKKQIDIARQGIRFEEAILKGNLSRLRWKQGNSKESEGLAKDSMAVLIEGVSEKKELKDILKKLIDQCTEMLKEQGRQIDEFFSDVLKNQEKKFGEESPQVFVILPLLAVAYFASHKYAEAESCYRRCIVMLGKQEDTLENASKNKQTLFTFMGDLASCLYEQGKVQEATTIRDTLKSKLEDTTLDPPHSLSRYLRTVSAVLKYEKKDPDSDDESVIIFYEISVEPKQKEKLPEGALLEFVFENGQNSVSSVEVESTNSSDPISVKSPHLSSVSAGYHRVFVNVWNDKSKTQMVGQHFMLVRAPISANDLESSEDIQFKMYEAEAKTAFKQGGGGGFFSF